jgi:predicted lipoprotein with Yx(FWY)xxD motif
MRKYFFSVLTFGALILGATQLTALSQSTTSTSIQTAQGSLGLYLADSNGRSLYVFNGDTSGQSNCNGQCAVVWPPFTAPNGQIPTASGEVNGALINVIQRSDGSEQVTYNGLPLYYYSLDQTAGQTNGEGINSFGANWYLVKIDGTKLMPTSTSSTVNTDNVGGAICYSNGQCCNTYGYCYSSGYTCDSNKHCCDKNGNCYDGGATCDSHGHCCDTYGHCHDNGFGSGHNGH